MTLTKRLAAEFLGTLWLVLGGCGAAVFAAIWIPRSGSGFSRLMVGGEMRSRNAITVAKVSSAPVRRG